EASWMEREKKPGRTRLPKISWTFVPRLWITQATSRFRLLFQGESPMPRASNSWSLLDDDDLPRIKGMKTDAHLLRNLDPGRPPTRRFRRRSGRSGSIKRGRIGGDSPAKLAGDRTGQS